MSLCGLQCGCLVVGCLRFGWVLDLLVVCGCFKQVVALVYCWSFVNSWWFYLLFTRLLRRLFVVIITGCGCCDLLLCCMGLLVFAMLLFVVCYVWVVRFCVFC